MDTVKLNDLVISMQGLGCMGMSEWRGPTDWESSIETIHRALELGATFLDTADIYGAGHNEVLIGRAIAGRRDQVQLATKFGIDRSHGEPFIRRGEATYVKRSCEASPLRLGVDVIDLYYLHRPPQTADIEETIGAMANLVTEGKVRHLGLSAVNGDLLRRAHAVHPITAVLNVMHDLGVGLVPYSPLGRGIFTETNFSAARRGDLRFAAVADAGAARQAITDRAKAIADSKGASLAQVALAWVKAQSGRLGIPVIPIPGTKRVKRLEENIAALKISLTTDELAVLGSHTHSAATG